MNYVSVGDMARMFQLRLHSAELQRTATRLTQEVATGVTSDVAGAVRGDYAALAGLDHSLATLSAYRVSADEAGLFAGSLQSTLDTVQTIASDIAPTLLSFATTSSPTMVESSVSDVRQKFFSVVGLLNTEVGGRYLLSGTATDTRPFGNAQLALDELSTAIAGQTTFAGVESAVNAWFDAPVGGGGFVDTMYRGSPDALRAWPLGQADAVQIDAKGSDQELREVLRGLAMGAVVAEGALSGDPAGRSALTRRAGEILTAAADGLVAMQADIGSVLARIETAQTRNSAETTATEIARNRIVATDPYESATALEAVSTQIETLYTLTARLSRLNLADYL